MNKPSWLNFWYKNNIATKKEKLLLIENAIDLLTIIFFVKTPLAQSWLWQEYQLFKGRRVKERSNTSYDVNQKTIWYLM